MPVILNQDNRLFKIFAFLAVIIFAFSILAVTPVSAESTESYTINITVEGNGKVTYGSVNGSEVATVNVAPGSNPTFYITPDASCVVEEVMVDGDSKGAVSQYQFTNVSENHELFVKFTITSDVCDLPTTDETPDESTTVEPTTNTGPRYWTEPIVIVTMPIVTTSSNMTTATTNLITTTAPITTTTSTTTTTVQEMTAGSETSTITPILLAQATVPTTTINVDQNNAPVVPTETSTSPSTPEPSNSNIWTILGIIGAVVVFLIAGILLFFRSRKGTI